MNEGSHKGGFAAVIVLLVILLVLVLVGAFLMAAKIRSYDADIKQFKEGFATLLVTAGIGGVVNAAKAKDDVTNYPDEQG